MTRHHACACIAKALPVLCLPCCTASCTHAGTGESRPAEALQGVIAEAHQEWTQCPLHSSGSGWASAPRARSAAAPPAPPPIASPPAPAAARSCPSLQAQPCSLAALPERLSHTCPTLPSQKSGPAQHSTVLSHGAAHAERQGMMGDWRQGLPTANSSRSAVSPTDTPDIAFPSIMPAIQGSLLSWVSTGIRSAHRSLADMGQ